jgi:aspartate 1-decarboxylase
MQTVLLKAKLHTAKVTRAELGYDGSCAIDSGLLELAGIEEFEQIHCYNLTNGERFITYAMRAKPRTGIISVNGAAAHKVTVGDRLIICAYCLYTDAERVGYQPTLVYLDADNKIQRIGHSIPVQQN